MATESKQLMSYSVDQLKIMAYDIGTQMNQLNHNLKVINAEIYKRMSEPEKPEVAKVAKVKSKK